jgi:hypothetical protein
MLRGTSASQLPSCAWINLKGSVILRGAKIPSSGVLADRKDRISVRCEAQTKTVGIAEHQKELRVWMFGLF